MEDVIPLSGHSLLVFFRDGLVRKCNVEMILKGRAFSSTVLKDEKLFCSVSVQTGGYGICWGEGLGIDDHTLYEYSEEVPFTMDVFKRFISCRIVIRWKRLRRIRTPLFQFCRIKNSRI